MARLLLVGLLLVSVCAVAPVKKLGAAFAHLESGNAGVDLSGNWKLPDGSTASIKQSGDTLVVTIAGKALGGKWTDSTHIQVTFNYGAPQTATWCSTSANQLKWSNGNVWTKAAGFATTDLSGSWDTTYIIQSGETLIVKMPNRPTATGKWIDVDTIQVTFPDDNTYTAKVENGGKRLSWSNATVWNKTGNATANLTGTWNGVYIIQSGDDLTINMPNRPTATGKWIDGKTIQVTFPDDNTYTANVENDGTKLSWSNATVWKKAGIATANLTGTWGTTEVIQSGDDITVNMPGRPTATGKWIDADTIQVTFPDDNTYTAKVEDGGRKLTWSNATVWTRYNTVNLTGTWGTTDIIQTGDSLIIKMPNRPVATGQWIDADTIQVTFPDDNTYTAKVEEGGYKLTWSNATVWTRTGNATANLTGTWGTTPITQTGDDLVIQMPGRPTATGQWIDSTTIQVTFPDDNTYTAKVENNGTQLSWSNLTVWNKTG